MNKRILTTIVAFCGLVITSNIALACLFPPEAIILESPRYIIASQTEIEFDGSYSRDRDENEYDIKIYKWDWNDDGTPDCVEDLIIPSNTCNNAIEGIVTNPTAYETAGIYTVKLEVTDDEGSTDTDTCIVYVTETTGRVYLTGTIVGEPPVENYYDFIQEAIDFVDNDNAPVMFDALITVNAGTASVPEIYFEHVDFKNNNLTLTSTDPDNPSATVIDGYNLGRVVTFEGDETSDCELIGFTIQKGLADYGGGIHGGVNQSSATIRKCIIKDNNTTINGAGLVRCAGTISDCIITGNIAQGNGGGLNYCNGTVTNCLIYGNTAVYGGGLNNCQGDIINCTIADNTATTNGGGLRACNDGAVTNCIVWGNTPDELNSNTATFTYNCINGWSGGGDNISADPQFVDADGADDIPGNADDDYHLATNSECIDKGTDTVAPATDMEGKTRPIDGDHQITPGDTDFPTTDMGAYEYVIYHVNENASSGGDGLSWATAFKYLQDAFDAGPSSGNEIWVATGTYYPDDDEDSDHVVDSRDESFALVSGVAMYGGFVGGETARSQRDWLNNETILSGDIKIIDNHYDDSYEVVVAENLNKEVLIDGFTVVRGQFGVYVDLSNFTSFNCKYLYNEYYGIRGRYAHLIVDNNYFEGIGTIALDCYINTSHVVTRSIFYDNNIGIYNFNSPSSFIQDCYFKSNNSTSIQLNHVDSCQVSYCVFEENHASLGGGGIAFNDSFGYVENCIFYGNTSSDNQTSAYNPTGAAVKIDNDRGSTVSLDFLNCVFEGNHAYFSEGGSIGIKGEKINLEVVNCTFSNNKAGNCGGIFNYADEAYIYLRNSIFYNNSSDETTWGEGHEICTIKKFTGDYSLVDIDNSFITSHGNTWLKRSSGTDVYYIFSDNIISDSDPGFLDSTNPKGSDDTFFTSLDGLNLTSSSTCRNGGNNSFIGYSYDILGNDRFAETLVDMGAYEYQPEP